MYKSMNVLCKKGWYYRYNESIKDFSKIIGRPISNLHLG